MSSSPMMVYSSTLRSISSSPPDMRDPHWDALLPSPALGRGVGGEGQCPIPSFRGTTVVPLPAARESENRNQKVRIQHQDAENDGRPVARCRSRGSAG